jgi:hypothetical protein
MQNPDTHIQLTMSLWRLHQWLQESFEQGYKHGTDIAKLKIREHLETEAHSSDELRAYLQKKGSTEEAVPDWVPED